MLNKIDKSFVILIAVLLLLGYWCIRNLDYNPQVQGSGPITIHWANQAGDSVTSLKGTDQQFSIRDKKIADSIAKVYRSQIKNLQEYIISTSTSTADIPAITGTRETDYLPGATLTTTKQIRNVRQQFSSPYYHITAQIGDSSYLQLKAWDTLTVVWKTVKEGSLFNRRKYLQLDLSHADTSKHITGLQAYRVPKQKPKRFGIGAQVGVTFDGQQARPYAGLGISYNFIRF